jgi:formate dehydrogenase subunit delta
MSPDRLIHMANQIGKFFQSQGHVKAVPGIAEHIRKFWDPRMCSAIPAHLDAGGGRTGSRRDEGGRGAQDNRIMSDCCLPHLTGWTNPAL